MSNKRPLRHVRKMRKSTRCRNRVNGRRCWGTLSLVARGRVIACDSCSQKIIVQQENRT